MRDNRHEETGKGEATARGGLPGAFLPPAWEARGGKSRSQEGAFWNERRGKSFHESSSSVERGCHLPERAGEYNRLRTSFIEHQGVKDHALESYLKVK